ncbi:hypothetical protein ACJX0J_022342, partial [Zea mays]
ARVLHEEAPELEEYYITPVVSKKKDMQILYLLNEGRSGQHTNLSCLRPIYLDIAFLPTPSILQIHFVLDIITHTKDLCLIVSELWLGSVGG